MPIVRHGEVVRWVARLPRKSDRGAQEDCFHALSQPLGWQALEAAERSAFAAACQGTAADICKAACLEVAAALAAAYPDAAPAPSADPAPGPARAPGRTQDDAALPPRIVAAVGHELVVEAPAGEAAGVCALLEARLRPGALCVGGAPVAGLAARVQGGASLHPLCAAQECT